MLKKIRFWLALVFWVSITLLFLDITKGLHIYLGWMAKLQFLPAILSINIGVILLVLALTFLFGRLYCSIICPLGVFQDFVSRIAGRFKKRRFSFKKENRSVRLYILGVFVLMMIFFAPIADLVAPYSAYGRMVSLLFQPIYQWIHNIGASIAEHYDSYAMYSLDVWFKAGWAIVVPIVTFIVVTVWSWKTGRGYCNTVCPVGTFLGLISTKSLFKVNIKDDKCVNCGLCEKNCKAQAIDYKLHKIDYSRCVACMNCIDVCKKSAIVFSRCKSEKADSKATSEVDESLRKTLATTALLAVSSVVKAQEKTVDGGLAVIEDKKIPNREIPVKPAGSRSYKHFSNHCTGCQLCVSQCPNGILRPSTRLDSFLQPEMSFERGYCRPECTRCSEVCPTGAIEKITREEKTAIRAGHAVWIKQNCLPVTDGVSCGNCASHCPSGAITMVPLVGNPDVKIPSVDSERCLGCGACEHLCPVRPFSAIYVEGNLVHGDF